MVGPRPPAYSEHMQTMQTLETSLTFSERRRARRYRLALPIELQALGDGTTRDLSTTGVFFETGGSLVPGAAIKFSVLLEHADPGPPLRLVCEGDVVRVECRDERLGVGATISTFHFDPDKGPIA